MIPSKRFVWVALLIGSAPFLLLYLTRMVSLPHYQYLPILFLVLSGLIWKRWDRKSRLPSHWFSWSIFYLGVAISLLGSWRNSPWLVVIGSIFLLGVFLHTNLAKDGKESLFYLFPLAVLALRLPMNLDERLVNYLQLVTAKFGSQCLDRLHVPHFVMGNVFELASGSLFVEEACSGIQSLFTLLFCSVLLVVFCRRSNVLLPLYCVSAVFWAVVMNIARIVIIAYAQHNYGLDLVHGWKHEALGYLCLSTAIVLLISADSFFCFLFSQISVYESGTENKWRDTWNWLFTNTSKQNSERKRIRTESSNDSATNFVCATVYGATPLLLIFQLSTLFPIQSKNEKSKSRPVLSYNIVLDANRDDLVNLQGFRLTGFEQSHARRDDRWQAYSDVWNGVVDGVAIKIALTQTYREWHNLSVCYEGLGWTLNERQNLQPENAGSDARWKYCMASFLKPDEFGYLAYSGIDVTGQEVNPIDSTFRSLFESHVRNKLEVSSNEKCLMIQVWATSYVPLSQDQVQAIQRIHLESREMLRKLILKPSSDSPSLGGS